MDGTGAPLLTVKGVTKRFPGVVALSGIDLTAASGEVHALVGANGAGKSTLMSLISGAQVPSEGEIAIDGKVVRLADPAAAQALGIATVYQEFSLVPQLSVARNIFLGREPKSAFGLIDRRRLVADTRALLDRLSLELDAQAEVGSLSVAEQQLVEIARALSLSPRILILDEPTAVLSLAEQDNLFAIIRSLKAQGILVLYVSHHLREVLAIADRVSVLRDGRKIATREVQGLALPELVELMIGRSGAYSRIDGHADKAAHHPSFQITYRADGVESGLTLRAGEILGLAGLVGAGRTTFARALGGTRRATASVTVEHAGRTLAIASPAEAIGHGIVYLTEDRKRDGIFSGLDIIANATAAALPALRRGPFRAARRERQLASDMLQRLQLVAASLDKPIVKLSGGNQQKVLIARALLTAPKLLVCDEPTRGVDVGAKAEIHQMLRRLASTGVAVLVISSEIEELLAVADRIVVMHQRRFVVDMPAQSADEARILLAASGGSVG
ncbi:MAG: sugar ABC transporter ATP-binding protein [Parvibaculaceae bacterium]